MKYFYFFLVLIVALTVCDSKDPKCLVPIVTGICKAAEIRYGFDVTTGQCTRFTYGGCQGNENNFGSMEECQAACSQ